jgi:U6 snRNA-associated Sm-like protein LSm1
MENLAISDAPPQGRGAPQPLPQLPPQMFTTAAQLLDLTDSTIPPWYQFIPTSGSARLCT